jgi:hypothetical protein
MSLEDWLTKPLSNWNTVDRDYTPPQNVLFLRRFSLARAGDKITIIAEDGEGGVFDLAEFEETVRKFFIEKF